MFRPLPLALLTTLALCAATAVAGEVFVSKDAQGHPIYTDRPDSLPAERVNVATKQTDKVDVQQRYAAEMKQYADADKAAAQTTKQATDTKQTQQLNAADKAKRCQEARTQYAALMNSHRVYEEGDKGERRYLDSKEIDAARVSAKSVMDEFCSGQ
jgi:hypothetical protein